MGREHDMFCRHCPLGCLHPSALHLQHFCLLVDLHFLRHSRQEFQWVEPGLSLEPCDARHREGELTACPKGCLYAQGCSRFCLLFQELRPGLGIKVCRASDEIAADSFFPDQPFVFPDGCFVGIGVMLCHPAVKCPDEAAVDQVVLGRDLRCGILRLPAADSVRFQNNCSNPLFLQVICCQDSGQPCPDDHSRHLPVPRERLPSPDFGIFRPD